MAGTRTPRSVRRRRHQRRAKYTSSRKNKRVRRSILDLLFLPPFLIVEELVERLREALNVN